MKKRQISEKMLNAFLSGELSSLLEAVKKDDTLDLELRGDSVNIYYRGGSIFKIEEINNSFSISFDTNYCTEDSASLIVFAAVQEIQSANILILQGRDNFISSVSNKTITKLIKEKLYGKLKLKEWYNTVLAETYANLKIF